VVNVLITTSSPLLVVKPLDFIASNTVTSLMHSAPIAEIRVWAIMKDVDWLLRLSEANVFDLLTRDLVEVGERCEQGGRQFNFRLVDDINLVNDLDLLKLGIAWLADSVDDLSGIDDVHESLDHIIGSWVRDETTAVARGEVELFADAAEVALGGVGIKIHVLRESMLASMDGKG